MSTDQTTNIGLPFLMPAQAQKHVTVNESLTRLDALVQASVKSRSISAQPGSPGDGERWICPAGKTGAEWGGFADWALAYYRDGAWEQMQPKSGWRVWIEDEARFVVYDGAAWIEAPHPSGMRNLILNGCFRIWQRGTSFTGGTTYTADRWKYRYPNTGDATVSRQSFTPGQTDVPGEPEYYARVTRLGDGAWFANYIEDVRVLAGQTATLTGYAKADAPFSLPVKYTQNFGVGGSSNVEGTIGSITLTTSWAPFRLTATLPELAGKSVGAGSYVKIFLGQAGTDNVCTELAQVQCELGPAATRFERRLVEFERALCGRYFERFFANDSYTAFGVGIGYSTTKGFVLVHHGGKRIKPTFSHGGSLRLLQQSGVAHAVTGFSDFDQSLDRARIGVNVAGGLTAGAPVLLEPDNDASAYLEFDADF